MDAYNVPRFEYRLTETDARAPIPWNTAQSLSSSHFHAAVSCLVGRPASDSTSLSNAHSRLCLLQTSSMQSISARAFSIGRDARAFFVAVGHKAADLGANARARMIRCCVSDHWTTAHARSASSRLMRSLLPQTT